MKTGFTVVSSARNLTPKPLTLSVGLRRSSQMRRCRRYGVCHHGLRFRFVSPFAFDLKVAATINGCWERSAKTTEQKKYYIYTQMADNRRHNIDDMTWSWQFHNYRKKYKNNNLKKKLVERFPTMYEFEYEWRTRQTRQMKCAAIQLRSLGLVGCLRLNWPIGGLSRPSHASGETRIGSRLMNATLAVASLAAIPKS